MDLFYISYLLQHYNYAGINLQNTPDNDVMTFKYTWMKTIYFMPHSPSDQKSFFHLVYIL